MRLREFSNFNDRTLVDEVTDGDVNSLQVKIVGVLTQLYGRIVDTGTKKPYSLNSLLTMLQDQGVTLNPAQFREMVQHPPLSNLIANVRGDDVIFKGQADVDGNTDLDAPDASTDTLDRMAKRAGDRRD